MEQVILGRTGIITNKNGFGALPIQRVSTEYAGMLLKKAYCAGMTFFDTARSYSDSEEKIGSPCPMCGRTLFWQPKRPQQQLKVFGVIWRQACD